MGSFLIILGRDERSRDDEREIVQRVEIVGQVLGKAGLIRKMACSVEVRARKLLMNCRYSERDVHGDSWTRISYPT